MIVKASNGVIVMMFGYNRISMACGTQNEGNRVLLRFDNNESEENPMINVEQKLPDIVMAFENSECMDRVLVAFNEARKLFNDPTYNVCLSGKPNQPLERMGTASVSEPDSNLQMEADTEQG